ncbi:MAG: hypothetical protein R3D34_02200 [Nitratireductor sp.]
MARWTWFHHALMRAFLDRELPEGLWLEGRCRLSAGEPTSAIQGWNKAGVYQKAIAYIGSQIDQ